MSHLGYVCPSVQALDLSEIVEDLDVSVSAGVVAPLATENGESTTL